MNVLVRTGFAALILSVAATNALALDVPRGVQNDERIRWVNYNTDDIVKVVGRYRASTLVEFEETEEIIHVAIGDGIAWEVAPAKNILFLKPREKNPPTNLQVVTARHSGERRTYLFELSATEGAVTARDAYFKIRFRYPADEAARRAQTAAARNAQAESRRVDDVLSVHQQYAAKNWQYSVQGGRSLQPDSLYDDGKTTTFRFAGNREIPSIYIVQADGTETLAPFDARDDGEMIVIHATAREFRLRRGSDVLCVFNEAYDPVGVNPKTGTTSPSVERVLRKEPTGSTR